METDRLLPAIGVGLVLGLVISALLLAQRRQVRPDLVGRVKADAYLAMVRAMLVLLAGLALALGASVAGAGVFTANLWWVAVALIAIGGIAFLARAALYLLRIKPHLDQLLPPAAPVAPTAGAGDVWPGELEFASPRRGGDEPPWPRGDDAQLIPPEAERLGDVPVRFPRG